MRYVVAARREARERIDPQWRRHLEDIPGVHVIGETDGPRAVLECAPGDVHAVETVLGPDWIVEPEAEHGTA